MAFGPSSKRRFDATSVVKPEGGALSGAAMDVPDGLMAVTYRVESECAFVAALLK
jgi:hypothetical protein